MKMSKLSPLFEHLGVRLMFAITINFYIILIVGSINSHSVTVMFNHFNEAIFEYIMYIIVFPIIVFSVYKNVKMYGLIRRRKND